MPASLLDSQLATLERPGADEAATLLTALASPQQLRDATLTWLEASDSQSGRLRRPSGH
jgi:gluconokinase